MKKHESDLEYRDQTSDLNRKESGFGEIRPSDDLYRGSTGSITDENPERTGEESEIEHERMTGKEQTVEH